MLGRVDVHVVFAVQFVPGERVNPGQSFDFIAPEFDAICEFFISRPAFHDVASDPEFSAGEIEVVSFILDVDQFQQHLVPIDRSTHGEMNHHFEIVLG